MGVKYKSEISLIGLVNWVLGLEKGTIWIVPFFSFREFLHPNSEKISLIPLQKFPSRNHGLIFRKHQAFEEPNLR